MPGMDPIGDAQKKQNPRIGSQVGGSQTPNVGGGGQVGGGMDMLAFMKMMEQMKKNGGGGGMFGGKPSPQGTGNGTMGGTLGGLGADYQAAGGGMYM